MQVLHISMLAIVLFSSILALIQAYLKNKGMKHEFYNWAFVFIPICIFFIYGLLSNFNNYVNHIITFSILLLVFEQGGINFFSRNIVRKQLTPKKSLGLFYSNATPFVFFLILFSLLYLLFDFPNCSAFFNPSITVQYLFHILARLFIWIWKFMVLKKLSHLSLGSTNEVC